METQQNLTAERKAWWAARRLRYNITLIIAAPVSAVCSLVVWGLFEERLPCVEITGFTMIGGAILFLPFLLLANACYSLGSLSERLINPRNAIAFRHWVYGAGVAFSLLLIFSPPIINLVAALMGPLPCTDKLGQNHASNPAPIAASRPTRTTGPG
jgi:hypothetical protein